MMPCHADVAFSYYFAMLISLLLPLHIAVAYVFAMMMLFMRAMISRLIFFDADFLFFMPLLIIDVSFRCLFMLLSPRHADTPHH